MSAGRKSKLTPKLTKAICEAIRKPTPATLAARQHGIHPSTFCRWMAEGSKEDAAADKREFREAIDQALGDAADTLLKPIRKKLFDGSTEQAKYLLTHMFPDEFGNRQAVELSGKDGGPIEVSTSARELLSSKLADITARGSTEDSSK